MLLLLYPLNLLFTMAQGSVSLRKREEEEALLRRHQLTPHSNLLLESVHVSTALSFVRATFLGRPEV